MYKTKLLYVASILIVCIISSKCADDTQTKKIQGEKTSSNERNYSSFSTTTTVKPETKKQLIQEIKKAIAAKGNTVDLSYIDTSAINNMSELFSNDPNNDNLELFNGDISQWNVSNVTNMRDMFYGNTAFNGDISKWNVSKVTNMTNMFQGASSFTDNLEQWKEHILPITHKGGMFYQSGVTTLPTWCSPNATMRCNDIFP